MKIFLRKLHRWLGLLMALQIIAWMGSGLYFSIFPISEIRGEHLTRAPEDLAAGALARAGTPGQVAAILDRHFTAGWQVSSVRMLQLDDAIYWRVEGESEGQSFKRLVDAAGGVIVPRLSGDQAGRKAQAWLLQPATVDSSEWVEPSDHGEFRGRGSPAWKVEISAEEPVTLYVDPWTGELLARRTDRWRIFDFLWMLHIMDYDTRDNFNTPLLQAAAALGLIIALSGVIYWFMTSRLFRRRRVPIAPP